MPPMPASQPRREKYACPGPPLLPLPVAETKRAGGFRSVPHLQTGSAKTRTQSHLFRGLRRGAED